MRSRSVPLFIGALLLAVQGLAQEPAKVPTKSPWSLGMRAHYGFLWPHRPASWILVEGHAPAFELFAERSVSGDRTWHYDYLMPSYGFGVLYTGMAAPDRIGAGVRVVPFLFLPFTRSEAWTFGMRLGWGVGYITKPFDRISNGKQIAIGSRINTAIQLMPELRYRSARGMISVGLGIDHWSNGAFKLPNLGLNYLSASLGAAYALGPKPEVPAAPRDEGERIGSAFNTVVAAAGYSETSAPLSGQYSVFTVAGQRHWRVSSKSRLSAGIDLFNKGSLATVHAEMRDRSRAEYTQLGVHGGYALVFGEGEVFINMGAYLYTPVPDEAAVFHRIGCRYHTGRHLVWNLSLKSHYAVADHWEFGIGYRWK